jgi:DNA-binding protein H-NS
MILNFYRSAQNRCLSYDLTATKFNASRLLVDFRACTTHAFFFVRGSTMAKQNLSSMTVHALLKLRDDIGAVLSRKADELKTELKAIGSDYADVGRIALYGKKSMAGRKVAIKYRDKHGNKWAGRGAQPLWMTAAIKNGAKREDFLVVKPGRVTAKKRSVKKRRAKMARKAA